MLQLQKSTSRAVASRFRGGRIGFDTRRTMASQSGPYDAVVIGGGPGGYVAAIKAAQLGLRRASRSEAPSVELV
ncbi:hypothetical protein BDM02DRAFT_1893526 [Thelephora ganbajun]|uniref:Uncharacterized protein n=1 Tax=Thelephora ganbajun TaxID=370292 RepID=A0ACB6ZUL9_THEGA|nr:hypothetical protein BDM02DRAFT_1893526 [Thelephora ganbajun]